MENLLTACDSEWKAGREPRVRDMTEDMCGVMEADIENTVMPTQRNDKGN